MFCLSVTIIHPGNWGFGISPFLLYFQGIWGLRPLPQWSTQGNPGPAKQLQQGISEEKEKGKFLVGFLVHFFLSSLRKETMRARVETIISLLRGILRCLLFLFHVLFLFLFCSFFFFFFFFFLFDHNGQFDFDPDRKELPANDRRKRETDGQTLRERETKRREGGSLAV